MLSKPIRIWHSKTELIPTAELRARHTVAPRHRHTTTIGNSYDLVG